MAARKALVIGNSAYPGDPLKNSCADAKAVAEKLAQLDFDVSCGLDLDWSGFVTHIEAFERAIVDAQAAVLFFAGHGIQVEGLNYLIPIGAEITQVAHLQFRAFLLNKILAVLTSHARSSIVILDACRKNPFTRSLSLSTANTERSSGITRSGLARVNDPAARGSFIAFAAGPDMPAFDGGRRKHSPFTTALLKNIGTRDVSISDMMINVRNDVLAATGGEQEPWDQNNLRERFSFNPLKRSSENQLSGDEHVKIVTIDPLVIEHQRWQNLEKAGFKIVDLENHIVSSPSTSPYVGDAERIMAAKIAACNDAAELESFVDRYPDSPRQPLVDKRLASLEWAKLANSRDVGRLRSFILTRGKAPECAAARERYGELVGPTLRESRDLEALKAFVDVAGSTRFGRVVQQRLEAIQRMFDEEQIAWSRLLASNTIKELKLFLATYPEGRHAGEAKLQLQALLDEQRRIAATRRTELWARLMARASELRSALVVTFKRMRTTSVASVTLLLVSDLLFVALTIAPSRGGSIFLAALAALAAAFAVRPMRSLTSLELVYCWIACLPAFIVGGGQLFSHLDLSLWKLKPVETGSLFGCLLTILSGALLPLSQQKRFTGGALAVFWLGTSFAALQLLVFLFEGAKWRGWWDSSNDAALSVWAVAALLAAFLLAHVRWRQLTGPELAGYWLIGSFAAVSLGVMPRPVWPLVLILILVPASGLYLVLRYRKRPVL